MQLPMKNALKSKWGGGIGTLLAFMVLAFVVINPIMARATPSQISTQATATATSTVAFMSAGNATSTYQIDTNGAYSTTKQNATMAQVDAVSMYVLFNASSSGSILQYQFQFSNNNIDWYTEGFSQTIASIGTATTSLTTHTYSSGVSGTSFVVVSAPVIPGYHERVVFAIPPGSANGAVYAEIDTKKNPSNP